MTDVAEIRHSIALRSDKDISRCPTCGCPVRVIRRESRHADHIEPLRMKDGWRGSELQPVDAETAAKLHKLRKGKKTVAIVGMAPTSCSLAPYEDKDVEIWGLNEAHVMPWMRRWDRWFQIHDSKSWKRQKAKRGVTGHFGWLQDKHYAIRDVAPVELPWWKRLIGKDEYKHYEEQQGDKLKPIYMQYWQPEVPCSVGYPLRQVTQKVFKNYRRGDEKIKYFTSTFAYMMGVALIEEPPFERIEIYGFEMAATEEYIEQKGCAEMFIGYALASGIEIYTPPGNILLWSSLYGGNEQGAGW